MFKSSFLINSYALKYYSPHDLDVFVNMFTNVELCQYMEGGAFDLVEDAVDFFEELKVLNANSESKHKAYGIFLADKLIGHFEMFHQKGEIEVIFLLSKPYWGKGIIQSILLYLNNDFQEKIIARVMLDNKNSNKMLSKLNIACAEIVKFNQLDVLKYTLSK